MNLAALCLDVVYYYGYIYVGQLEEGLLLGLEGSSGSSNRYIALYSVVVYDHKVPDVLCLRKEGL